MSTENEGTAVPSAPDAPSASAPEGTPAKPTASTPPAGETGRTPEGAPHGAREQGHAAPAPGAAPAPEPVSAPAPNPAEAPRAVPPMAPPPPAAPPAYPAYGAPGDAHAAHATQAYAHAPAGGGPGDVWGAPPAAPVAAPPSPRKRSGGLVAAVLVAALVAGGVGGGIGYWAAERNDSANTSTTISVGDTPADFKRDPGTVAAVASKALPSVVTIEAKSGGSDGEGGTGTGFVYDREGHILTNNHVVASAAENGTVTATFSDGRKFDAEVVGRAQGYDVAVLKLRNAPSGLAPLPLGNSDKVVVGDSTIAIGAPFGLSNTVTTGIISAKNRPVASSDGSGGKNSYMSALQTDASINPGNSGGPLLDGRGAVIGINSAIQSPGSGGLGQSQAGSVGLGFAIPINQAKNVAEQLIKTGEPVYPMIGATVNMSEEGEGATIVEEGTGGTPSITPNGPAAKAGLRPGDVITRFGDRIIDSGPTLISEIWTHQPGDTVALTYKRGTQEKQVQVTLGERKGD
ncbi:trypsin-like peptidase domain-containing protein [Streptomyces sp. TRM76323]|uniref:Trypsin-like peptidase domain-containing protein n=1 Tax=Streptomyces tamarix TaxID=3078565 RepID=A0ABU3QGE0_9ACTN|nr:trypsin-like peptidase domain-containing protein [Streptomyces tamarix]MDT9681828.1 trypsin-like peptidase domain-containing protein [Streptomyces tamarix]